MGSHYGRFGVTLAVNTVIMFLLTYAMICGFDHFYLNISNLYMALMMVGAMALLMMFVMRSMFGNRTLNYALYAAFAAIFVGSFALGRVQGGVGDEQFLRAMIPHHSRAILVCQEATLTDPDIIGLCRQIVDSQQREIDQMKDILARY